MPRKYRKPPAIEAVCEFRVAEEISLDNPLISDFGKNVEKIFPSREERFVAEIGFAEAKGEKAQEAKMIKRIIFFSQDKLTFAQIDAHFLSVNSLKPYCGWTSFVPKIEQALKEAVILGIVKTVTRIGIRYVNKIELPVGNIRMSDYFLSPVVVPPPAMANSPWNGFYIAIQTKFQGTNDGCSLQFATVPSDQKGHAAFVLDVDYYNDVKSGSSVDNIIQWLKEAHTKVRDEIFEKCITDKTRELFEEEK